MSSIPVQFLLLKLFSPTVVQVGACSLQHQNRPCVLRSVLGGTWTTFFPSIYLSIYTVSARSEAAATNFSPCSRGRPQLESGAATIQERRLLNHHVMMSCELDQMIKTIESTVSLSSVS